MATGNDLREWKKDNEYRVTLSFNYWKDEDVRRRLELVNNKTDYIRQLILEDIKKGHLPMKYY